MFITRVDGPDDNQPETVQSPSLSDVEEAIRKMDGIDRSLVMLGTDGPVPHMGIGGGLRNWFIVYVTHDNQRFYNLRDDVSREGEIEMVCGGQTSEFALSKCVTLETAIAAARSFAVNGALAEHLQWV